MIKLKGKWLDIDHGTCWRCGAERNLYRPLETAPTVLLSIDGRPPAHDGEALPAIRVCAPCSQILYKSTLTSREDEEPDEVAKAS